MMELADMRDLGSRAARRVGSTPTTRTKRKDICFQQMSFLFALRGTKASPRQKASPWGEGTHRFVPRHCEEGRRPDVAIRISVQRETDSHGPFGASE